jgi:nicotinamidase-related amidase
VTGTALLVMDVQEQVVRRYPDPDYLPLLRTALDAARAAGIPVIYVVVDFRPGYPEISARNKMFGGLAARAGASAVSNGIHPEVTPEEGEIVVSKRRVSAFSGSDLELLLRAQDIGHLVLTGIATSGVVLSTLREAADMDYELTVLADGCLDADPEVQRVLTEKVFPMQAGVVSIADWAKNLEG